MEWHSWWIKIMRRCWNIEEIFIDISFHLFSMGILSLMDSPISKTVIVSNKGIHPQSDWLYRIEACAEHNTFLQFWLLMTESMQGIKLETWLTVKCNFKLTLTCCQHFEIAALLRSRHYSFSIKWRAPLKVLLRVLQCGSTGGVLPKQKYRQTLTICIPNKW